MNEAKLILNRLLDKYEQSAHFSTPGRSNRRVLIKTDRNGLPEYDYQKVEIRDAFNAAIRDLSSKKVIFAAWLSGRKELLAKEIWLNLENVDVAYSFAARQPLKSRITEYLNLLKTAVAHASTPWIKKYFITQSEKLHSSSQLSGIYKKGPVHFSKILDALNYLDRLDDNGKTMRAFSIACYHDSKYFERNIRDDFLAIARDYYPPLAELLTEHDLSSREQLAFLGIYTRPEIFEFTGPLGIQTKDGLCDCAPLARYGCALTSTAALGITQLQLDAVNKVTFIENKTNYDEYIEKARLKDELVIYHGGFLSPQKKKWISRIAYSCPAHTQQFFWADIDLGGFRMFDHLKNLVPGLLPWKMDMAEVTQYATFGLKRSESYMKELEHLLGEPEGALFADAIKTLLHYGVTIEQEVMLSDL